MSHLLENRRKTKIVCTLGPSTDDENILRELMKAGMDVARFNFSHGSHEEQAKRMEAVSRIRRELHLPIAAMLDTKGPEIRIGTFKEGAVELKENQSFVLTARDVQGDETQVSITYKNLVRDVKPGDHILIDDGLIDMEVEMITKNRHHLPCHQRRTHLQPQRYQCSRR